MSNGFSKAKHKALTSEQQPQEQEASHKVARKKVPWGPWVAVFYALIVFFVTQLIAGLVIVIYPYARGWEHVRRVDWLENTVTAQFWAVLLVETLTIVGIWLFVRWRGARMRSIGWTKPGWWDPVYALAGFLPYFVAYTILLIGVTALFPSLNTDQKQQLGFSDVSGFINLTLTFFSLVVLPPLAEETVFRGFIFTAIRDRLSFVWSMILTSIVFAVPHLQFGSGKPLLWAAALDVFVLSLVLCYLREKTNSLWPGIFLHAFKNCIAFITLFLVHVH